MTDADAPKVPALERNFARCLKVRREALGIPQATLAEWLTARGTPMHQQTIARIESGQRAVRLAEAMNIARELKMELAEMTRDPLSDLPRSGDRQAEFNELSKRHEFLRRALALARAELDEVSKHRDELSHKTQLLHEEVLAKQNDFAETSVRLAAMQDQYGPFQEPSPREK